MPTPGGRSGGGGFKKGGFKKGAGAQRKSFDRGAPTERKSYGAGFKKSYGPPGAERKSFGPGGFKKSFDRGAPSGERKSFAPGGFKKSYDRPEGGAGAGFKKSYDRPEAGGFKKSYDRPAGGGFKKFARAAPEGERSGPPGGFKKTWDRAPAGDRPPAYTKSYDRDAKKAPGGFKKKSFGDAPGGFKKSFDRGGGDRPAFGKKSFDPPAPGEERIKRYDKPGGRKESPRVPAAVPAAAVPANDGRWVWGINPVLEALRAHPEQVERIYIVDGLLSSSAAAEILSRSRDANLKVDSLERDRLTSMIGGGVHQGVVAEVREYQYKELEDLLELAEASGRPPLIVVLDGIQDPHNLGAIIRSAHSFGAHGVVVAKGRAAGVTGMVAKSSAGAIEHCPVARVTNIGRALEQLKEAGCWTVAADPEGDQPAWKAKLDGPLAIVVGSEGPGVREGVLGKCDFKVLIPMTGNVASLNASVSAGVLLYEVSRQRALQPAPAAASEPE